jgi:hypothetical protein
VKERKNHRKMEIRQRSGDVNEQERWKEEVKKDRIKEGKLKKE